MFIDTHCHLENKYYDNIDKEIYGAVNNNVELMIVSGCEKETIDSAINLANNNSHVFATIGYHPDQVYEVMDHDLYNLENKLKNDRIVGVGEIGLDYHYGNETKEKQKKLFRKQLKIAEKLNLPVVIHSRDATNDTINILKEFNVKGVIHCFSGSLETANIYIKMGFKLGIGGVVTFKNSKLKDVIKNIDISNIVLETDSPYLAPTPYRGKTNSPKYIPIIAEFIANIYNISISEFSDIVNKNTNDVFNIINN